MYKINQSFKGTTDCETSELFNHMCHDNNFWHLYNFYCIIYVYKQTSFYNIETINQEFHFSSISDNRSKNVTLWGAGIYN